MTDAPLFPFNPATVDWTLPPLVGWTYVKPKQKWFQGTFRNVHTVTRNCPTCSEVISIDVTEKALRGEAQNHGLALRRCRKCRAAMKAADKTTYRARKAKTEEPALPPAVVDKLAHVELSPEVAPVVIVHGAEETAALRATIHTMSEELSGLYVQLAELRERLSKYELPEAMAAVSQQAEKMPWQQ